MNFFGSELHLSFLLQVGVLLLNFFFPSILPDREAQKILKELTPTLTPSPTPPPSLPSSDVLPLGLYDVVRVVDGDTVVITDGLRKLTVRLIGINAPESVDPRRGVECFGREASSFLKTFLSSKSVSLQTDPTQSRYDRYGRLLGYLFLEDGTNVNLAMIKEGYAYEYTYDSPYQYQVEFQQAEDEAQRSERGLWSERTCNGQKGP